MLITEGSMLYWNLQAYIVTFTLSNDVAGNLGTIGKYCPLFHSSSWNPTKRIQDSLFATIFISFFYKLMKHFLLLLRCHTWKTLLNPIWVFHIAFVCLFIPDHWNFSRFRLNFQRLVRGILIQKMDSIRVHIIYLISK